MSTGTQDLSAIEEFERSFASYQVWAKKEQGPLIEDRGRKVRMELYKLFRGIAQSPAQLRAEIAGRGYAVRRRADESLTALYPAAAAVGAVPRISMEDEIRARVRSLRFLSVSFIIRGWRSATEGQSGRFSARTRAKQEIGSALVRTAKGETAPFVSLTSLLEGAVVQNRQRLLADQALFKQAADMAEYVRRKHVEKLAGLFREPFNAAISA